MNIRPSQRTPGMIQLPDGFVPFDRSGLERSVPELFEEQAALSASHPALRSGPVCLSYARLNESAGQFARALRTDPDAGDAVAILLRKDPQWAASILGTLKAGKYYIPIDPAYPAERISSILRHSGTKLAITSRSQSGWEDVLSAAGARLVFTEDVGAGDTPRSSPGQAIGVGQTAAIFYTSGSTGTPKGVIHTHRSLLHSAITRINHYGLNAADQTSLLTPPGFAASQGVLLATLLCGGTLHLFDPQAEGLSRLARHIAKEQITVTVMTPSLLRNFLRALAPGEWFPDLRMLIATGEPLYREDVVRFWAHAGDRSVLVQQYASTESFIMAFQGLPRGLKLPDGPVPAGFPAEDKELLIVDEAGRTVADGVPGEIVVRSLYLSPGYWRDDAATQSVFRHEADGTIVCRTGDQGQKLENGSIQHLGRGDGMVKVRGFRVELAEIDAALAALPEIREACTLASLQPDGQVDLAAFYSRYQDAGPSRPADIRAALAHRLPDFMRPHRLIELSDLPRGPLGKIDRPALQRSLDTPEKPPARLLKHRDILELQLRSIWERSLRKKNIGPDDDFFQLGGDSLAAARIFQLIEKHLGLELPLSSMSEHRTVGAQARLIRGAGWQAVQSPAVLLQPQGESRPLFIVPGAGSDVFALIHLARALAPEIPVYGLQHRGISGDPQFNRSIEEMADYFLEHLRRIQPVGPYRLCGTSFGGIVAFEMARRLLGQNQAVEFLGLLDTHGPGYPRRRKPLSPRLWLTYLARQAFPIGKKDLYTLANFRAGLSLKLQQWYARASIRLRGRKTPPLRSRFLFLQEVCFRATRRYAFGSYPGRMHLFAAAEQPRTDLFEPDEFLGWSDLAGDGIERIPIPGDHGAYLREPHAGELANQLRHRLASSRYTKPVDTHDPRTYHPSITERRPDARGK